MEQINKVEIRGYVGNVRVQDFPEKQVASFSVVTNYVYRGRDSQPKIEAYWFNVVAWSGRHMPGDFNEIRKGGGVSVTGRMREREYEDGNGEVHKIHEVVADKVEVLDEEEKLQPAI